MVSGQPLQLLGGLSAQTFLRDYWQKKPLLVRQAIPGFQSPISADELAGLSLEEDVESRLILEQGQTPWELRHGPFAEDTYQQLPESHWTLLVQAVDQWVPEVAGLKERFRFLPQWRMDDIMISYAAPGGGVGPHYDNYDVFLLQAQGHRRWRIGPVCDGSSPLLDHPDLRILAEFQNEDEWVLAPGDLLYLPPCLAHFGTAEDECMTWSLGFRAPSAAEVLTHFSDFLAEFLPDEQRYTDPDLQPAGDSHKITGDAVLRLKTLIQQSLDDDRLLLSWFGQFMTEPRYPEQLAGQEISEAGLRRAIADGALLARNPASRLAWAEIDLGPLLFAGGQSRLLSPRLGPLLGLLCSAPALYADNLAAWLEDPEALTLITELLRQGSLEFASE